MATETDGAGLRVYKFGGASVKDAASIRNVCRIVRETQQGRPLLIVVSAMGKTTNALEEIFDLAWRGQSYEAPLANLENYHQTVGLELLADYAVATALNDPFHELRELLSQLDGRSDYDEHYDQIVSYGELLSSRLVAWTLNASWEDCRRVLRTDRTWRDARLDWPATSTGVQREWYPTPESRLQAGVIVTQGFLGGTADGRTTTLGREGSDYSAAIFAYCLGAESVTIWKDVPGLLNADPRIFPDTVLYPEISYQETIEMAYYGASVIHPKTLQPLAERGIPLYVKSFLDPGAPGTVIHDCRHPALAPAFIRKAGQCLLSFESKDFAFISEENLAVIFGELAEARLKINLMQNSAISFSVGTDYHEGRVQRLLAALGGQFRIHYNAGLTLFTIKNYDEVSLARLTAGRELLLEQRTRSTFQFLVRE